MGSDTESKMSSLVSTPCATPTSTNIEVENPATIQSNPKSLNERWTEVRSDLASEIELAAIYGTVSPNILIMTKILENLTQTSSVLFQKVSESKIERNVEMLSKVHLKSNNNNKNNRGRRRSIYDEPAKLPNISN